MHPPQTRRVYAKGEPFGSLFFDSTRGACYTEYVVRALARYSAHYEREKEQTMSNQKTLQTPHAPARWVEILITLLGLLGLALGLAFYEQAFPSASLDLMLARDEIAKRANAYVNAQGYDLNEYEFVLTFAEDFWGSVYLQRTLGVPETNRRIRAEKLPIWYWHARWFKPLQKEEFAVNLATDGTVIGFSRQVLENTPGAKLDQDAARALAEKYLVVDRGWTRADWERVTASTEERPGGRADHHFEWKRRDFSAGEGELRVTVDIQGDRVGDYRYWIKAPETFTRHFEEQQNRASFFGGLSFLVGFVGIGGAVWIMFMFATMRGVRFSRLGIVITFAVAVVSLLSALNYFPLMRASYDTTQDYAIFWSGRVIGAVASMVFTAAIVLILWHGGQRLSRRVWRYEDKILARGGDRWETLARSTWRGLMLGCISGGYVVVFYLIATQLFGSWTPLDAPTTDLYATPFPFLAPLEIGLIPATTEELTFRLAGISLILIALRQRFRLLALLVPGALWGFAHLGYVTDPFYLRGIELTIAAMLLEGFFFYAFDLTTTIVGHMTYNAGLMALVLMRSTDPYFVASGVLAMAILFAPIVPGLVRALMRRARRETTPAREMQITSAMPADAHALAKFEIKEVNWSETLADSSCVVLCLRADAEVIGVAAAHINDKQLAHVFALCVEPAWQRRFWGTRLLDELGAQLKTRDVTQMQATVESADKIGTSFWASQRWFVGAQMFAFDLLPKPMPTWRVRVWEIVGHMRRHRGM